VFANVIKWSCHHVIRRIDDASRHSKAPRYAALYSGGRFFPQAPAGMDPVSKIDLEQDIARGLGHTCRFNGQCAEFYSVAQHSILVAELVEDERLRLPALLHDAAEAYIGDIVTPIKMLLPFMFWLERRIQRQLWRHFGLEVSAADWAAIKQADLRALATEKRDLLPNESRYRWQSLVGVLPDGPRIVPMDPAEARMAFMAAFERYSAHHRGSLARAPSAALPLRRNDERQQKSGAS
jgi:hypothetical protein